MGAKVVTPRSPDKAQEDNVLALKGMKAFATNFLANVRLGEPTLDTLGYPLTDKRLTDQEIRFMVQSDLNAPKEGEVAGVLQKAFKGDVWGALGDFAVDALNTFFGSGNPEEKVVNDEFAHSFLVYENGSVVQYSLYLSRTSAKSIGTLTGSSRATMITVVCKGNVDYAKIDPQTVISTLRRTNPKMTQEQVDAIIQAIEKEMEAAARIAAIKRELEAGMPGKQGPKKK